jgi:hypothetical protein
VGPAGSHALHLDSVGPVGSRTIQHGPRLRWMSRPRVCLNLVASTVRAAGYNHPRGSSLEGLITHFSLQLYDYHKFFVGVSETVVGWHTSLLVGRDIYDVRLALNEGASFFFICKLAIRCFFISLYVRSSNSTSELRSCTQVYKLCMHDIEEKAMVCVTKRLKKSYD